MSSRLSVLEPTGQLKMQSSLDITSLDIFWIYFTYGPRYYILETTVSLESYLYINVWGSINLFKVLIGLHPR